MRRRVLFNRYETPSPSALSHNTPLPCLFNFVMKEMKWKLPGGGVGILFMPVNTTMDTQNPARLRTDKAYRGYVASATSCKHFVDINVAVR